MPIINTVIQGGGSPAPSDKFGATIDTLIGTLDANGVLQKPTTETNLVFTGVKGFSGFSTTYGALNNRFRYLSNVKSASFPDLEVLSRDLNDNNKYCLSYAFDHSGIVSVDLSKLTTVAGTYCFQYAFQSTPITSINLSKLHSVTGDRCFQYAFQSSTSLTTIDVFDDLEISNAASAFYQTFYGCTGLLSATVRVKKITGSGDALHSFLNGCTSLTSVDISTLVSVSSGGSELYSLCEGCTSLPTFSFTSLAVMTSSQTLNSTFKGCTNLSTIYFWALKDVGSSDNRQFYRMLYQKTTATTVHFPSNMQSVIGSWSDVVNGFNGTNTTVLFDLPSTQPLTGADTNVYDRNPKYDTGSALAWKIGIDNPEPVYYTSGTTDPQVGDTIYSDSACTTAVTTIDSIA